MTRVYTDGHTALKAFSDNPPDLGVFDIKMPQMDGMELLRRVRETSAMPVIFLTSKDDELDEALGLAMGADDYISKPFSQRLLIARIRALLRRQDLARGIGQSSTESDAEEMPLIERGRLVMDPARHKVLWDGKDVTLYLSASDAGDGNEHDLAVRENPRLVAAGYRVITMDLRGLSNSSVGWPDHSAAAVGSDVVALMAHLRLQEVALVGNSMGGWIAALYTIAHPERVERLVLVDAAGFAPPKDFDVPRGLRGHRR